MSQAVCILGVTGSIGQSTLKILQQHPEDYSVFAITAFSRIQELVQICKQFRPKVVVIPSAKEQELRQLFLQEDLQEIEILFDESQADESYTYEWALNPAEVSKLLYWKNNDSIAEYNYSSHDEGF